mmetsp:Transcript_16120/g.44569  ORF Transcript_16120/g.44569 Transcript_16120/m.44569 type:complete len:127 (-) Transcript_16120:487-867(-)
MFDGDGSISDQIFDGDGNISDGEGDIIDGNIFDGKGGISHREGKNVSDGGGCISDNMFAGEGGISNIFDDQGGSILDDKGVNIFDGKGGSISDDKNERPPQVDLEHWFRVGRTNYPTRHDHGDGRV